MGSAYVLFLGEAITCIYFFTNKNEFYNFLNTNYLYVCVL
jgi:hypothetical protein